MLSGSSSGDRPGRTGLIDSENAEVRRAALSLTGGLPGLEEKARALFYFIRDQIHYEFRPALEESAYRASSILSARKGFCTQKAILFCAMARASSIPARIHFYDIVDHTLPLPMVRTLRTRTLYRHGIAGLYLEDGWYAYDATLDAHLIERKHLFPVEFEYRKDCLMHPVTPSGGKHIEYITEYDPVSDVTFGQIMDWLAQGYPHLYHASRDGGTA